MTALCLSVATEVHKGLCRKACGGEAPSRGDSRKSVPQPVMPDFHQYQAPKQAASHSSTTTTAPTLLVGFAALEAIHSSACVLHSARTSAGKSLIATHIRPGSSNTSSKYPSTGMKSGIRSIGLSAYATTNTPRAFAYQGVRGFFPANHSVTPSRLIRLAQVLRSHVMLISIACHGPMSDF